jgi:crotonobetainyl-CoA:carnitine CoA-transferase CaiB-like acyl-CoA transferase
VAQSLVLAGWRGMADRAGFDAIQAETGLLVSMGRDDQRAKVT